MLLFADETNTIVTGLAGSGATLVGVAGGIWFLMRWFTARIDAKDATIQVMMTEHHDRMAKKDDIFTDTIKAMQAVHVSEMEAEREAGRAALEALSAHCKEETTMLFSQLMSRIGGGK